VRLRAGDRVDHYTLVKPLGEGGQGSVWQVVDPRDGGVTRALKLVRVEETGRAGFDRARREAKILAAAKHPALVRCHGFFEDLDAGLVGLVMDLVPGPSLADAVEEGRLDRDHALAALQQVASALAYIHGAGLVHRDLKLGNVLSAERFWESPNRPGAVKLVDFGIAAPLGNPTPLTSVGAVVGTLPYLAPELIDPATWGRTDGPARDLFAFGVLAWEALFRRHPTGLRPEASMVDFARAYKAAQAGRIAWPPAGLDGAWQAAVGACLALRPADRPTNGAALCEILRTGVPAGGAGGALAATTTPHRRSTPLAPPRGPAGTAPWKPTKPARIAGILGWTTALVGFVAAMITVTAVLLSTGWLDSLGGRKPESPPYAPPPTSASSAPAPPPTTTSVRDPGACCPKGKACKGPTRFSCPACSRDPLQLPRGALWSLRVNEVEVNGTDLVKQHPGAVLAMRVGASAEQLPFAWILSGRAAEVGLPVTTEDVEHGGVRFTLTEGKTTLADGAGYVDPTKGSLVKVSALCAGLRLLLDSAGGTINVWVYLDPRDPAP
jgi:serine/threonine-protein kinase